MMHTPINITAEMQRFSEIYKKIKRACINLAPLYATINFDELFADFTDYSTILQQMIESMPAELATKFKPSFNSTNILINSLASDDILVHLVRVLKNNCAGHIADILIKIKDGNSINLDQMNMKIAIAIRHQPICKFAVLEQLKVADQTVLNSLYASGAIGGQLHVALLEHAGDNNYIGDELVKSMIFCNDDRIRTHWFPFIDSLNVNLIEEVALY